MEINEDSSSYQVNSYSGQDLIEEIQASTSDLETPVVQEVHSLHTSVSPPSPQLSEPEGQAVEVKVVEDIPFEHEAVDSFHASPPKDEEEFDFEKELPESPCDTQSIEHDLLMNFSTTHFQVEDAEVYTETPVVEEFETKMMTTQLETTKSVDIEIKSNIVEQEIPEPKAQLGESSLSLQSPTDAKPENVIAAAPALLLDHVQEKPATPEVSVATSKPAEDALIEPTSSAEEMKTRSVKSTKSEPGRSDSGKFPVLLHYITTC